MFTIQHTWLHTHILCIGKPFAIFTADILVSSRILGSDRNLALCIFVTTVVTGFSSAGVATFHFHCRNYSDRMFTLPVAAPLSKKIAHLFPVSFQVPTLKWTGYQHKSLPTTGHQCTTKQTGDENTEDHQLQETLLNSELTLGKLIIYWKEYR